MPEKFINKYVSVTPEVWDKIKKIAELPENRRPVGIQAGMILKEAADKWEGEKCLDS
jgi:hypothetical protein